MKIYHAPNIKIMGIDPSLNSTGYCILENNKIIAKGEISTGIKSNNPVKRLRKILTNIEYIEYTYHPRFIVIEDYSYGSRGNAIFSLGELGGILKIFLLDKLLDTIIVSPTLWKKALFGKGNLKKEQILLQTFKKYKLEFNNNNICDAFCLAKFGDLYYNNKLKVDLINKVKILQ